MQEVHDARVWRWRLHPMSLRKQKLAAFRILRWGKNMTLESIGQILEMDPEELKGWDSGREFENFLEAENKSTG